MVLYFNDLDNRPDAVSSAHWRDYSVCFSDAPHLKDMRNLPVPDNLALPLHYTDSRIFPDLIFAA